MRITCGWRGEEGGDPASPINSETASNDQMEQGGKGKKNVSIIIRRTDGSLTDKLGRIMWESTHIEKEDHTNVVGKVVFV